MKFEKADKLVRAAIGAYNSHFNINLYPKERHQEVIDKSRDSYNALVQALVDSRKKSKKKKAKRSKA